MDRQEERAGIDDETAGGNDHGRDHQRGDSDTDPGPSQHRAKAGQEVS